MASDIEPQRNGAVIKQLDKHARYRAKNRVKRNAASARWWRENGAAYREKNRRRLRKTQAKWRDANRETARQRVAAYQRANPEKQRASEVKYRAAHPDRRKESCAKYLNNPVNRQRESSRRKAWSAANLDRLAAQSAKRRALKLHATPSWAKLDAIGAIYAECARLTRETGIAYHVDHIYPLKSKWMCGLHCEANLQILVGAANLSKGNRHWPGMEWSVHPTIIPDGDNGPQFADGVAGPTAAACAVASS